MTARRIRTIAAWTIVTLAVAAEVVLFILAQDHEAPAWSLVAGLIAVVAAFCSLMWLWPRDGRRP